MFVCRVCELEHREEEDPQLPAIITALKAQLEQLRAKLDTVEHLNTRGGLLPHGTLKTHSTLSGRTSAEYRRASEHHLREVRLKFSQIW